MFESHVTEDVWKAVKTYNTCRMYSHHRLHTVKYAHYHLKYYHLEYIITTDSHYVMFQTFIPEEAISVVRPN